MSVKFDRFIGRNGDQGIPLYQDDIAGKRKKLRELLWGDGVFLLGEPSEGYQQVRARGSEGWIETRFLTDEPLLDVYFIDVGQGDGVFVRTPDMRHILIDAGFPRSRQPTNKSAADFVDWKFHVDYSKNEEYDKVIRLDAMVASHNDLDHYGGLSDLIDVKQTSELGCVGVSIENFFHSGLSWWEADERDNRSLGSFEKDKVGDDCYVDLLDDRDSALAAADGTAGAPSKLQGEWGKFIAKVTSAKAADGSATAISRLSHKVGMLPGFEEGDLTISVLGPVERNLTDGRPGLRKYPGDESKSTNGHSIVLMLKYRDCKILLTGDLNALSQKELLDCHGAAPFLCDVAKACHHGSDDVSMDFLRAMQPGATVICSGDGEGHDHPRPRIIAASGLTGRVQEENDKLITPLVYSTEIARSHRLGSVHAVEAGGTSYEKDELGSVSASYKEYGPSLIQPKQGKREMRGAHILAGLVYGLVNVRTDGKTIMCATQNEHDKSWSIKCFTALGE